MQNKKVPRVSIGLPVYNGENFLQEAVESILSQTFEDFELIISDNASTDRTEEICRAYEAQDSRISYYRNEENMGASRNYTRVFELSNGEYFKWAAHDDVCLPDYLTRCVEVLDEDYSVVLCHSKTASINAQGKLGEQWDSKPELDVSLPHERFRAALALSGEIFFVWGLARRSILQRTALLGSFIGHDRALLSRLSLYGRIHEIPDVLFLMRHHEGRSVNVYNWRQPRRAIIWYDPSKAGKTIFPSWRLMVEHIYGISQASLSFRERLRCYVEMAMWLNGHRQELLWDLILAGDILPGISLKWIKRFEPISRQVESIVPEGDKFIFVDEGKFETEIFGDRQSIPFLEKDGVYWGFPADDENAINELERLRRSGAKFMVFTSYTFWWLDYYKEFHRYLTANYTCLVKNSGIIIFNIS